MAVTWSLHGRYVVVTWPLRGHYLAATHLSHAGGTGAGEYVAGELGYAAGDVVRSTRNGETRDGRVIKMNKAGHKWQVPL